MNFLAPYIRIGLRYLAGALVAKGVLDPDLGTTVAADPEVIGLVTAGVGIALGAASEAWYAIARKLGWAK